MNTENQTKTFGQKLRRSLWSAAGAVGSVLEKCPTEHNKYAAIGLLMIFIALLACVSFAFFLSVTFGVSFMAALPFGLLWGGLIFCLDRVLLTSYRKGETGKISVAQRFLLTAAIALIIGEPFLLRFFQSEINLELTQRSQTVLRDARANAEARFTSEKESLETSNKEINDRLDALKKDRDEKEQAVIVETEGKSKTGKSGFGIAAKQKESAFTDADEKYKTYKTESAEILQKNRERLAGLSKAVEDETALIGQANSEAKGILARHKALIAIVRNDLGAALIYIPLFISLLFLETLPLSVKVFGKKGVYEKALESEETKLIAAITEQNDFEKDEKSNFFKMKKTYSERLFKMFTDGKIADITDENELRTIRALQTEMLRGIENESIRRQSENFDFAAFGDEIVLEVIGDARFEFVCNLPKNARKNFTLETMSGDLRRIAEKVGRNLRFSKAFSSLKSEISASLPLLPQLEKDRKMFLVFEPIRET